MRGVVLGGAGLLRGGALRGAGLTDLPHHAVPDAVDLLAVFAIGQQVEVVGEGDGARQPLQQVDAETLAAALLKRRRWH